MDRRYGIRCEREAPKCDVHLTGGQGFSPAAIETAPERRQRHDAPRSEIQNGYG